MKFHISRVLGLRFDIRAIDAAKAIQPSARQSGSNGGKYISLKEHVEWIGRDYRTWNVLFGRHVVPFVPPVLPGLGSATKSG